MALDKLGRAVTSYPKLAILSAVIITLILGSVYFSLGAELRLEEETYLPDNELVQAHREIRIEYGPETKYVPVVVKARDSNVLRVSALTELVEVENGFLATEEINSTLVSEEGSERVLSPADIIVMSSFLLELIDSLSIQLPQSVQLANEHFFEPLNFAIAQYNSTISARWNSEEYELLNATIYSANENLTNMTTQMEVLAEALVSELAPDTVNFTLDTTAKISFISNLSDSALKALILDIVEYNKSKTEGINTSASALVTTLHSITNELTQFNLLLRSLKSDPNINHTLLSETDSLSSNLTKAISGTTYQIDGLAQKLNSYVALANESLQLLLSVDFNGTSAKACVLLLSFNGSLLPGESRKERFDRFLELENKMLEVIEDQNLTYLELRVLGEEIVSNEIIQAAESSLDILLPLAFVLVLIVLGIAYRNVLDVLFSLLALSFSVLWVWGLGALLGFTFNPITIAVPVLIAGLGIDFGIHVTLRYREELSLGRAPKEASFTSIKWVGGALALTAFTTIVAFLSNLASDLRVVREFGILCALGIGSAFILMLIFVPACKQVVDMRKLKLGKPLLKSRGSEKVMRNLSGISRLKRGLGSGVSAAEKRPGVVLGVVLLLTFASAALALNLSTEYRLEDFLPEELEVTHNLNFMLNEFNFTTESANILIKGDVTNPVVLERIDATTERMSDDRRVVVELGKPKVISILSLMEDVASDDRLRNPFDLYDPEFHLLWLASDTNQDGIPDINIHALYDLLYKNENTTSKLSQVLHRTEEGDYDGTVLRISVDTEDGKKSGELYEELKEDCKELSELVGAGVINQVTITGVPILTYTILETLNDSMLSSLILTIIIALITLTLVFWFIKKSLVLGLITTLPVLLVISWILGTMFVLRIPYNILTISVTALTIGLGIDYAIHITYRFLEESEKFEKPEQACREAVLHTGSALFAAALTTIAAFGILIFSLLPPMKQFGGIVALTILYSFIASVFVLPSLLLLWAKRK